MSSTLQTIKSIALKAVNAVPVSSAVIGSPRRTLTASQLNPKTSQSEYITIRKAENLVERPPITIDKEIFFKYENFYHRTIPEQFILKLQNGRVWGRNGAIITADDVFISDLSQEFGPAKFDIRKHSIWRRLKLKKPVEIAGKVAVIASPGGDVYAHWLCDIMPRLVLLKNQGLLEQMDKIVMSYGKLDWQTETLDRLGIDKTKIINTIDDPEFHLRAEALYIPSYPNLHGTVNDWVCKAIRDIYIDDTLPSQKHGRLFISRAKAKGRQLLNEEEVFAFLEKEYGFRKVFAEDYATPEKARLFYDAECIIGPHGGGFTNLLFCSAGCKVVDIFPPSSADFTTYFWVLANANQLAYAYLFGKGEMPTKEKDVILRNQDIDVDLDRLKTLTNKLNLPKR
ncbi:MAG TPA: glycosyltransferase family 61 protein [Flavisolibacter sp.]|nr:glycosyltransferase family 61 protein [Flavisolibacter sp.]